MAKKNPYDDTQLAGTLGTDTTQGTQPAQPPAGPQPATPAGGGADAGTTAQAPAQKSSPNRFQNLQRMLYANQGQGAGVAHKVQSTAQNLADAAQSQLGQVQANYRAQAAQGQGQAPQAPQSPYADRGGTAAAPLGRDGRPTGANALVARNVQQVIGTRGPDLRHGGGVGLVDAPAVSDAQLAQYYNQLQGLNYTGPNSLAQANGYGDAVQAADRAAQAGQALQSQGGIQALLGEGGGGGALDSLLAQQADGRGLQAAGQRFAGLRQQLATAGKDTGFSTQAKNQVAALNQQGLAGNVGLAVKAQAKADAQAAQDKANQQSAADETAYKAYQAAVKKGIGGGPLGPQWAPGAPTLQDWIAAGRPAGPQKQAQDPGQWG